MKKKIKKETKLNLEKFTISFLDEFQMAGYQGGANAPTEHCPYTSIHPKTFTCPNV